MPTRRRVLRVAAATAVSAGAAAALELPASAGGVEPDPAMSRWYVKYEHVWNNEDYSEELQGITAGRDHWYLANNSDDSDEGIWRVTPDFASRSLMIRNPEPQYHLGDIGFNFANNHIYAALEPARVWDIAVAGSSAATVRIVPLDGNGPRPQGHSMPWCSVNPLDGLLYSSAFGDDGQAITRVTQVHAYDPAKDFAWVRTVNLPHGLRRVQGGSFSELGRLYLTSDETKDIRGYSLPPQGSGDTAGYLGTCPLHAPDLEVEGVAVGHPTNHPVPGDDRVRVHAVCLDNDWPSGDDAYIKHISVPEPKTV